MIENDKITLEHIEIEHGNEIRHAIIWLHGLGADGSDFVPIVPELHLPDDLGARFIFPHAPIMPITINNGYNMRAWYDIISLTRESPIDKNGILNSVAMVNQLIKQEIDRGIPANRIILAGFSQGAAIALTAGLRHEAPLGGIIALSGYLPMPEESIAVMKKPSPPIFIAHGTEDPVVPYALGKSAYSTLQTAGCQIDWHSYQMQHSVCAEEIRDISLWIQRTLEKH